LFDVHILYILEFKFNNHGFVIIDYIIRLRAIWLVKAEACRVPLQTKVGG